MQIFKELTLDL